MIRMITLCRLSDKRFYDERAPPWMVVDTFSLSFIHGGFLCTTTIYLNLRKPEKSATSNSVLLIAIKTMFLISLIMFNAIVFTSLSAHKFYDVLFLPHCRNNKAQYWEEKHIEAVDIAKHPTHSLSVQLQTISAF